ncbi:serine hydrolase domain-containing protein [Nonomuraea sp. NPDC050556]|uniref:serine hydrolase domain-containing protein n=1 Tax=Nonomuraea sp. NPDC050556 TaxID=3364369 RepID=UPI00378AAC2F
MRTTTAASLALAALAIGLASAPAQAVQAPGADHAASLREAMNEVVRSGGVLGVQARLTEVGKPTVLHAGKAMINSGRPVPAGGYFRMGSATKTFTAATVLHLAGEGRIRLDEPIGTYLPGLLPRQDDITVRMILQHTSGVPNYTDSQPIPTVGEPYLKYRWTKFTDEKLVAAALKRPLDFEPGTRFAYSNTGYVVLGMLVKAVTGNTWQSEVTKRIIKPLGLKHTSAPVYSTRLPGPHAHGYIKTTKGYADVTRLNPSIASAGGAMISTTADLTTFITALQSGKLLKPAQLAEMTRTVPIGAQLGAYGLGIREMTTTCNRKIIGHTGGIPGYLTAMFTSTDGKTQLALSANESTPPDMAAFGKMIDSAFCH